MTETREYLDCWAIFDLELGLLPDRSGIARVFASKRAALTVLAHTKRQGRDSARLVRVDVTIEVTNMPP